jgi:hypothetical protein
MEEKHDLIEDLERYISKSLILDFDPDDEKYLNTPNKNIPRLKPKPVKPKDMSPAAKAEWVKDLHEKFKEEEDDPKKKIVDVYDDKPEEDPEKLSKSAERYLAEFKEEVVKRVEAIKSDLVEKLLVTETHKEFDKVLEEFNDNLSDTTEQLSKEVSIDYDEALEDNEKINLKKGKIIIALEDIKPHRAIYRRAKRLTTPKDKFVFSEGKSKNKNILAYYCILFADFWKDYDALTDYRKNQLVKDVINAKKEKGEVIHDITFDYDDFAEIHNKRFNEIVKNKLKDWSNGRYESPYNLSELPNKVLEGSNNDHEYGELKDLRTIKENNKIKSYTFRKFGIAIAIARLEAEYNAMKAWTVFKNYINSVRSEERVYETIAREDREADLNVELIESKVNINNGKAEAYRAIGNTDFNELGSILKVDINMKGGGRSGSVKVEQLVGIDYDSVRETEIISSLNKHLGELSPAKYITENPGELFYIDKWATWAGRKLSEGHVNVYSLEGGLRIWLQDLDKQGRIPEGYKPILEAWFDYVDFDQRKGITLKEQGIKNYLDYSFIVMPILNELKEKVQDYEHMLGIGNVKQLEDHSQKDKEDNHA